MVLELYSGGSGHQKANYHNSTNNNNNNHSLNHNEKPLLPRNNLLCPNEVTFCELSDDESSIGTASISGGGYSKNRRRTISGFSDMDEDSILSGITTTNTKVKSTRSSPRIPDGGYGWVVVFASVMVSLVADGISFSFGLLYIEFLNYFNESTAKTSWIGSIFLSVPLLSGPVMSNLVDRYGCRRMTIVGGLLSGTGFILAAFSNSVEMLYWTFGVVGGLGLGIGYVTAVVSIAFWFDKKRTFATGIGASGTGLGTFLYAPFTQWLIKVFGWRGCCLILAGTLFNICVFGALMRDPDWLIENKLESRSQSVATISNASECLDEIKKLIEKGAPNETVLETLVTNYNTEANQQINDPDMIVATRKCRSELLLPTFVETMEFDRDGIKRGSRRSLRRKVGDGTALKTALLTIPGMGARQIIDDCRPVHTTVIYAATDYDRNAVAQRKYLASMETLNASEKVSYYDELSRISTDEFDDLNEWTIRVTPDNGITLSCQSLPDSLKPDDAQSVNEQRLSFRHNSLDAIYENSVYKKEMSNIKGDRSPGEIRIDVPRLGGNGTASQKKRHHHAMALNAQQRRNILRSSNYFRDMRIHRNSFYYRGAMLNTHRYRLRASSCPNIYRNSMTTLAKCDEEVRLIVNFGTLMGWLIFYVFFFYYYYRSGMIIFWTLSNRYSISLCLWSRSLRTSIYQRCCYSFGKFLYLYFIACKARYIFNTIFNYYRSIYRLRNNLI